MSFQVEDQIVEDWIIELVEEVLGPSPFAVGDTVRHPTGRMVKIVSGQYWGTHGLSNHWHWREVLSDGTLSETEEHGYGWRPEGNSYVH